MTEETKMNLLPIQQPELFWQRMKTKLLYMENGLIQTIGTFK